MRRITVLLLSLLVLAPLTGRAGSAPRAAAIAPDAFATTPPLATLAPPPLDARKPSVPPRTKTMPALDVVFDGLGNSDNVVAGNAQVTPAYANGDVGPAHYVQATHVLVRIYNHAGTPLTAAFRLRALFASLGANHPCATDIGASPMVLHDHLADRWVLSMGAFEQGAPYHLCVAISAGADPTAAYHVYGFSTQSRFHDRAHIGLGRDAYVVGTAQFDDPGFAFAGSGVFALERARFLSGDPAATLVYLDAGIQFPGVRLYPADLDGPPPAQPRPHLLATFTATEFGDSNDALRLFEFVPSFVNPSASVLTALPLVLVSAFDPVSPTGRSDIPQPSTAVRLDAVANDLMHRLQFRSSAMRETLVTNHTVDASGDPSAAVFRAAVRYYELARIPPFGNWSVAESATFAPADTTHRWLGSAALDRVGNLAVGYSVSSDSVSPGIRYAGRLATDAPGGLMQGEAILRLGTSSQTNAAQNRWGELSALTVDPVDDCTYWYTNAFYALGASACTLEATCWRTRIAAFRYPSCTGLARGSIAGTVTRAADGAPIAGARVSTASGYIAFTDATGQYALAPHPGAHELAAAAAGYRSATAGPISIAAGSATAQNFQLDEVALLSDGFEDP